MKALNLKPSQLWPHFSFTLILKPKARFYIIIYHAATFQDLGNFYAYPFQQCTRGRQLLQCFRWQWCGCELWWSGAGVGTYVNNSACLTLNLQIDWQIFISNSGKYTKNMAFIMLDTRFSQHYRCSAGFHTYPFHWAHKMEIEKNVLKNRYLNKVFNKQRMVRRG